MKCPACKIQSLELKPTTAGAMVDYCRDCGGVWMDKGEIFLFSKDVRRLERELASGLASTQSSDRLCPRCESALAQGTLFKADLQLEQCPECEGLWFDGQELARALEEDSKSFRLQFDPYGRLTLTSDAPAQEAAPVEAKETSLPPRPVSLAAVVAGMTPLPNLFLRSAGTLALLYGLLGLVLLTLVEFLRLPLETAIGIGVGLAAGQFMLSPFIMDLTMSWLYNCSWIQPNQLPAHLYGFVQYVSLEQGMKFPRFGVIDDGAPNAFAYGHTPNSARIVVTRGLLELLDEEEVQAVVAHEMGHAKHWDMLLMTVAGVVPLVLYYVYRMLIETRGRGRLAGVVVFVLYIVSEYIVLWFSRTREFHADRFAARVTRSPNCLASALVKIAYGLAGKEEENEDKEKKRSPNLEAVGALGIFDPKAAQALAITAYGVGGVVAKASDTGKEAAIDAMRWDMWNPWAKWYEINSTHPLVASRLNYLGEQALSMDQEPYVVFDRRKPESYWDEFLVDFFIYALPLIVTAAAVIVAVVNLQLWRGYAVFSVEEPHPWIGVILVAVALASLVRTLFQYYGGSFPHMSIGSLLKKVKVSAVRPVPVTLRGRIIGRGVPGLIWSEDLVIQDHTGILFLDYRQPLAIWEWLFGLRAAGEYIGREVEVTGWYRRSPMPYLEIKTISLVNVMRVAGSAKRSYTLPAKIAWLTLMLVAGLVALVIL